MFYVEIGTLQSSLETPTPQPSRKVNAQARKTLAGLRLVNKRFCHSASIRLFRHIIALAGSLCHTTHLPPVEKLMRISNSQYAQYVHQVDLGYGSLPYSVGDIVVYTEDLAGLLSSCLRQLPNLKALNFSGPPLTSLPHDEMKASIEPILMVLCYVPLPNLSELEIMLPMTNNFAPLFAEKISTLRIPIEQTLSRLHYLGLHVYAQANQQSYASHLLRIVELSTNLTSLSLSSPNFLSIDSLRLSPRVRLRYLFLQNVNISSQNMVDIIEQSIGSLTYIE
jgi:Leucine-rich repeat (LRR) protein